MSGPSFEPNPFIDLRSDPGATGHRAGRTPEQRIAALEQSLRTMWTTRGNFKVGGFSVPGSTGNHAVTGVGFQPGLVLFTASLSDEASASIGEGAMDAAGSQWAVSSRRTSGGQQLAQTGSYCVWMVETTTAYIYAAQYVSMDADGFTINFTHANSAGRVKWVAFA